MSRRERREPKGTLDSKDARAAYCQMQGEHMADIEKMVHFKEWAKDKTFLIRTAALQFALPSKDLHDALKKLKAGERMEGYDSLPPIDEWLELYKNHGKVYLGLTNSLRQLDNRLSEIIDFYEGLMFSLASLRHITQSEFQEAVDELKSEDKNGIFESLKENFKAIENLIIEDHLEDSEKIQKFSPSLTTKLPPLSKQSLSGGVIVSCLSLISIKFEKLDKYLIYYIIILMIKRIISIIYS